MQKQKIFLDFSDRLINSDSHPTIGYIRSKQRLLYYNYYYQSGQLEKAIKAFESFFHVQDSVNQIAYHLNNFSIGKEVDKIKSEYLLKISKKKNEIKTILHYFNSNGIIICYYNINFKIFKANKNYCKPNHTS